MSETEPLTGRAAVEQGQGYTPAPTEPVSAEPTTYGPGIEGIKDAANDLTRSRGGSDEAPLVKRELSWLSGDKAGQTVDLRAERMSLTPEAAAKVLSQTHRTEDTIEARDNLIELQREVDLARYQVAAAQQPQTGQQVDDLARLQLKAMAEAQSNADQSAALAAAQPEASQPQAESADQPSGIDPDFAQLLERKPALREQLQREYGAVEQARQQFVGATAHVANMLIAELTADLPEIAVLPPEQRMTGLAILQSQQPERFAALEAKAGRIQAVVQQQQQHNAMVAQQQQQRFAQWSKAEDAKVEAAIPGISNDPDMKVSKAAIKTLKDVGFDESDLAKAWHGEVALSLRDHRAQILIWKAAQYDMAKAGIGRPESKPLPAVQRPGIAPSAGERSAVDLSELRNEFKRASGNEQLRLGAKLMRLQRGG